MDKFIHFPETAAEIHQTQEEFLSIAGNLNNCYNWFHIKIKISNLRF